LTQNTTTTLQRIAIHLNWNLHSGAGENIISSLLAASFNHSREFKEWFLERIDYGRKFRENLYAVPNMNIGGSIIRAIQKKKKTFKDKDFPKRPDVVIVGNNEEKEWDKLEASNKKKDLSDALRSIRLIDIEVKHIGLTSEYDKKYDNLIKGLASFKNTGRKGLLNRHRFVIVSSHSDAAKDRIIRNDSRKTEEERWYKYFRCGYDGVKHLTVEEIYKEIRKNKGAWCDECPILELFEYYLALYLGIFDDYDFGREYWKQIITTSTSAFDLKWNVADHISWLASNASVKTARGEGNKWHENKARKLRKIEFLKDEKYGRVVRFEYNNKRSQKQLTIVSNGDVHSLDIEKIKSAGNYAEIMEILKKVGMFIRI